MPFVRADIAYFLSGGTGNSNPLNSLGNGISNTSITGSKNSLFPNVIPTEALSGVTRYRCMYVKNLNTTMSLQAAKIWILSNTISAFDEIDIGLGTSGLNGTEPPIANEFTVPSNVVFTHPTSEVVALTIGNMSPLTYYPIWLRCVVALNADYIDLNTGIVRVRGTPV